MEDCPLMLDMFDSLIDSDAEDHLAVPQPEPPAFVKSATWLCTCL